MKIYIKDIRDGFSEVVTFGKRSEGWIGFNYVETGLKSIPERETTLSKALWQRSQWDLSGKSEEEPRGKIENVSRGQPCRAVQALLRGFVFILRTRGRHFGAEADNDQNRILKSLPWL